MNLQTKISLEKQESSIKYDSEILMLGSCFSENIGEKFEYYKFKNLVNPFGILFHPKAIETFLWMSSQDEKYVDSDVFYHNDKWHCFDAHSSLSSVDKNVLLHNLNKALEYTKEKIRSTTHVFITLGTAWAYRLRSLDMFVANCHKIPQREFEKILLSIEEIAQCLQNTIHFINSINPSVNIVFTVSPVRHSKDGFVENNRSKSHLISAVHQVIDQNERVSYFPSYEIMMDELRDYRFYGADMIHPNNVGIQYIWERFSEVWISEEAQKTMLQVDEIQKGIAHRPFNPNSEQHLSFLKKIEFKKDKLKETYPFIQF